MTLIVFDIPDELNIPGESLEDLAQKTAFFSLSTEWRWFGGAHLDNLIVAVPEAEVTETESEAQPEEDGDTSAN